MKSIFQFGFWFILFAIAWGEPVQGQTPDFLRIRNPSFDAPNKYFVIPPAWSPQKLFLAGKNIKDLRLSRFYRKEEKSQKGDTHVALATFANGTRENVGQKLKYPIIRGHSYTMDIWLAWSPFRTSVHPIQQLPSAEHDLRPVKIQLYGFRSEEDMSNSLLAETNIVDHQDWRKYTLEWTSPGKFQYFYLVATWYGSEYYDGNILLDNVSDIRVSMSRSKN